MAPETFFNNGPSAPHGTLNGFVPRPYPSADLAEIPSPFIIDMLHVLAPEYWNNIEKSNCTIAFPLEPHRLPSTLQEASINPARMRVMRLHQDFLVYQSSLIRDLLSGASPLDLMNGTPAAASPMPGLRARRPCGKPALRPPHLLPSQPDHPVVFLPLPDPASFQHLVTYMYFGTTETIEQALLGGAITWDGLARNVEYLGMDKDIRRFLGRWYRWTQGPVERMKLLDEEDSESDESSDSDSEGEDEAMSDDKSNRCEEQEGVRSVAGEPFKPWEGPHRSFPEPVRGRSLGRMPSWGQ